MGFYFKPKEQQYLKILRIKVHESLIPEIFWPNIVHSHYSTSVRYFVWSQMRCNLAILDDNPDEGAQKLHKNNLSAKHRYSTTPQYRLLLQAKRVAILEGTPDKGAWKPHLSNLSAQLGHFSTVIWSSVLSQKGRNTWNTPDFMWTAFERLTKFRHYYTAA